MTDSVFIHEVYPFLNDEPMELREFFSSLIKLDSMIANAVEWKQKLAHEGELLLQRHDQRLLSRFSGRERELLQLRAW